MSSSPNRHNVIVNTPAASSPAPHVAIDMQPLSSTFSTTSTAPARSPEPERRAVLATRSDRSRSRSRSSDRRATSANRGAPEHRSIRNRRAVNATDGEPLLQNGRELDGDAEMMPKKPTLVDPESLDDEEEEAHPRLPNTPLEHPGVDEGFFNTKAHDQPDDDDDRDADDRHDGPGFELTPRIGGDSDDGSRSHRGNGGGVPRAAFPPSFVPGPDGTMIIPDVNVYQQKKTLAQGMMDLALLSANANQLRYVLESNRSHPYFYVSLVFITMSIVLQVGVGVGLIMNSRYNVKDEAEICKADKINNLTVLGIFMITCVNVFITSFGVAAINPAAVVGG